MIIQSLPNTKRRACVPYRNPVYRGLELSIVLFVAGCTSDTTGVYRVTDLDVNLGNIMYDSDEGMYDVWYRGVELASGERRILVALETKADLDRIAKLSVGDRVRLSTDLRSMEPSLLDAYPLGDIDMEFLD